MAEGLNLYGFAGGDPVNFSDPFGLCPENQGGDGKTSGIRDCPEGSMGRRMFTSGAAVGGQLSPIDVAGGLVAAGRSVFGRAAAATVGELIMPGGSAIGAAGSRAAIREVVGDVGDAAALFGKLRNGGTLVEGSYPGTLVNLPNGGSVGLRTIMSRSPGTSATIDVNIPGISITKIKFNPPE